MRINKYVKQWYNEDYDIRKEDFYIDNARWMLAKAWKDGGVKHGRFVFIISAGYFLLNGANTMALFNALLLLSIFTIAFFFYAIREYGMNDALSSTMYILTLIFLFWTKSKLPEFMHWILIAIGVILYAYLTFIKPHQAKSAKRVFDANVEDVEQEEEEKDKQTYAKWEAEYKAYRHGLPWQDISYDDPMMVKAMELFTGYTDDKAVLRDRYRQLAKQHHPDNGGDEYLFQCISAMYEKLQQG